MMGRNNWRPRNPSKKIDMMTFYTLDFRLRIADNGQYFSRFYQAERSNSCFRETQSLTIRMKRLSNSQKA